jgi:hypothetical protein
MLSTLAIDATSSWKLEIPTRHRELGQLHPI